AANRAHGAPGVNGHQGRDRHGEILWSGAGSANDERRPPNARKGAARCIRLWSWQRPVKPAASAASDSSRGSALNGHKVDRGVLPSSVHLEIELESVALVDSL